MTKKNAAGAGLFTTAGKALDESLEIAEAVRTGTLTRSKFYVWYEKRAAEGAGLVVKLRQQSARAAQPLGAALAQGKEALRSAVVDATAVRAHRARRARRGAARSPSRRAAGR